MGSAVCFAGDHFTEYPFRYLPHPYGAGARRIEKVANLRERRIAEELIIARVPSLENSIRLGSRNDEKVGLTRFMGQRCTGGGDDLRQRANRVLTLSAGNPLAKGKWVRSNARAIRDRKIQDFVRLRERRLPRAA
jgi:hypothetical protein